MKRFKIIVTFAGHIITAVLVFCAIGCAAWILHLVRAWLEADGLDGFIVFGLHALEIVLFACDVVATGFWSIMSTKTAIFEILDDESNESVNHKDSSDKSE